MLPSVFCQTLTDNAPSVNTTPRNKDISENTTLHVALPIVPGVMYRDSSGKASGFSIELLSSIVKDLEMKIEWHDGTWSESFEKVKSGDLDILPSAFVTPEREKIFDFLKNSSAKKWSELYLHEETELRHIIDLNKKKIGLIYNDENGNSFEQYIRAFGIEFQRVFYDSHKNGIEALKKKEIFAMAGPAPEVLGELTRGVRSAGLYFGPKRATYAFRKGFDSTLRNKIDHRLGELINDTTSFYHNYAGAQSLKSQYYQSDFRTPAWIFPVLTTLAFIALAAITFILLLRFQVKRKTRDLRQKDDLLLQARKMESIGQLAGGVAHDFNNMLAGVVGFAELLQETELSPEQHSYCENIIEASANASNLTQQLLTFARKAPSFAEHTDIHKCLESSVQLLERTLDKKIDIQIKLQAQTHHCIGDVSQLQNAFLNLGINACAAMNENGTLEIKTSNWLKGVQKEDRRQEDRHQDFHLKPGNYIKITFKDNGSGIKPEHLNKIFEPFFSTKEIGKGTGMGLASVYGTIKSHQGAIYVDSQWGEGTCFTLYFPAESEKEEMNLLQGKQQKKQFRGKVLIIEDEKIVRTYMQKACEDLGLSTRLAKDGLEGVKIYQDQYYKFDYILLDVIMPRKSGMDTLTELKNINPDCAVIMVSGYPKEEDIQTFLKKGAAAFLKKPFRKEELSKILEGLN
jgi:signal transduction histidine kinase/CheY-like chemotaxis protein/ABC-type amino acid transport substrate-binding protein